MGSTLRQQRHTLVEVLVLDNVFVWLTVTGLITFEVNCIGSVEKSSSKSKFCFIFEPAGVVLSHIISLTTKVSSGRFLPSLGLGGAKPSDPNSQKIWDGLILKKHMTAMVVSTTNRRVHFGT